MSGDGIGLRRAGAADAPALAQIGTETFVETFGHLYPAEDLAAFLEAAHSAPAYARLLAEPGTAAWLAQTTAGTTLGYLVAGACKLPVPDLEARAGEIRRLYLRGSAQNRGLGTRLLEIGCAWLASEGRTPLYVGVWSGNPGAQRLYARHGFVKIGEYDFPVGRQLDREHILRQAPRA